MNKNLKNKHILFILFLILILLCFLLFINLTTFHKESSFKAIVTDKSIDKIIVTEIESLDSYTIELSHTNFLDFLLISENDSVDVYCDKNATLLKGGYIIKGVPIKKSKEPYSLTLGEGEQRFPISIEN